MPHHTAVLNPIFKGKNIESVLKSVSVKYSTTERRKIKIGALREFSIGPKYNKRSRRLNHLISDDDLIAILKSSHKTLQYLNVTKCSLITDKSLEEIGKLKNLKKLSLSENS